MVEERCIEFAREILKYSKLDINPELNYEKIVNYILSQKAGYNIDDRSADILYRRYIKGETYRNIAIEYGLTSPRVSQLQHVAEARLRRYPAVIRCLTQGIDNIPEDRDNSLPIEYLNLPTRITNSLLRAKVVDENGDMSPLRTINDIAKFSKEELCDIRGMSMNGVEIVSEALLKYKIELK